MLYDDKIKALFHLKNGQKGELILNLIFPDYPDGNNGEDGNEDKEKRNRKCDFFFGVFVCPFYGAGGRGRTDTVSLPLDFESSASANSTTPAFTAKLYYILPENASDFSEVLAKISAAW